ncbi:hypothetical protein [Lactococcus allomyrinae]|uniref:DUF443 family protein n=1 Tax=Lactococcus allomyrinae TaxID=2419773 RepID=A0A387B9F3_9LACT|nr:hypothetical protein [Lactococcus allomyrinae]AYG00465.1 hypothetical protein D7I46_04795 [Lactococcus allomyrinae]
MDKYHKINVEGQIFQFSFNQKKPVKGWLLLQSNDDEYLIKQNSFLFRNVYPRKIYQSDIKLSEYKLMNPFQKKNTSGISYIGVAVVVSAAVRALIPAYFFFGNINYPISIGIGIVNILFLWIIMIIVFSAIALFRKILLSNVIKKLNGDLALIGKMSSNIPLGSNKAGVEGTDKKMKIIAFISLSSLIIPITIIFPFFVGLRAMGILIAYIGSIFFFNGNYASDGKRATYEIKILERENR